MDLYVYDVYYVETDNTIDFVRYLAEDEDHARNKFLRSYPETEIFRVEYRGEA